MKTLQQKLSSLPAERRKKIVKRTDELVAEETAIRGLLRGHPVKQVNDRP